MPDRFLILCSIHCFLYQVIKTAACRGYRFHNGDTKKPGQFTGIDNDISFLGFIYQVQSSHDRYAKIDELDQHVEVPCKVCGIKDHYYHLRFAVKDCSTRYPLVFRDRPKGVAAWKVDYTDPEILEIRGLSLIHISEPTRLGMISY